MYYMEHCATWDVEGLLLTFKSYNNALDMINYFSEFISFFLLFLLQLMCKRHTIFNDLLLPQL